jgi:hypothetical protein
MNKLGSLGRFFDSLQGLHAISMPQSRIVIRLQSKRVCIC